jgi:hypothetical protein
MSPQSTTIEEWETKHVKLSVEQEEGFWCAIKLLARVPLAPDTIFDLLTDPHNHRVFRGVKVTTASTLAAAAALRRPLDTLRQAPDESRPLLPVMRAVYAESQSAERRRPRPARG